MEIRKQIESLIGTQEQITAHCYLMIEDIRFLSNDQHPDSTKKAILSSPYFSRVYELTWEGLILRLMFLFSDKEQVSFSKLLNVVTNNFKRIEWHLRENMRDHEIKDLLRGLAKNIESDSTIRKVAALKALRDKRIAHFEAIDLSLSVHIQEASELYEIAVCTIKSIGSLIGRNVVVPIYSDYRCESVIAKLIQ